MAMAMKIMQIFLKNRPLGIVKSHLLVLPRMSNLVPMLWLIGLKLELVLMLLLKMTKKKSDTTQKCEVLRIHPKLKPKNN